MTTKQQDEIAALRAEVDKLKASLAPTPNDPAAVGKWRDEMHALAERRAAGHLPFSREDLQAMEQACPTSTMRDIALRDARAPTGRPGMLPSSQQPPTSVRPEGNRSGWVNPVPLSNPPGTHWVDALCEVDSAKQRGEAMVAEARRKAAEDKPE